MANVSRGIVATEASIHSRSAPVFSFGRFVLALLTPSFARARPAAPRPTHLEVVALMLDCAQLNLVVSHHTRQSERRVWRMRTGPHPTKHPSPFTTNATSTIAHVIARIWYSFTDRTTHLETVAFTLDFEQLDLMLREADEARDRRRVW
jgi:hypothetical protein